MNKDPDSRDSVLSFAFQCQSVLLTRPRTRRDRGAGCPRTSSRSSASLLLRTATVTGPAQTLLSALRQQCRKLRLEQPLLVDRVSGETTVEPWSRMEDTIVRACRPSSLPEFLSLMRIALCTDQGHPAVPGSQVNHGFRIDAFAR